MKEYLFWVSKNQAKKTHLIKLGASKHFFAFLDLKDNKHILYIQDITTSLVEKYKLFRLDHGVTNRTINIELNFISNCLKRMGVLC